MSGHDKQPGLYALVAEFNETDELLNAAEKVRDEGYKDTDAHVPFPVHGLDEALGIKRSILPWFVLLGGILGGSGGYLLQYWVSVEAYPLNIGGRPLHSWPSFVPIIFECTILGAGLTTFFAMLGLNGLPRPHHPVFNTPNFEGASEDRYFLAIEATDPKFDLVQTKQLLESLGPVAVSEVTDE